MHSPYDDTWRETLVETLKENLELSVELVKEGGSFGSSEWLTVKVQLTFGQSSPVVIAEAESSVPLYQLQARD